MDARTRWPRPDVLLWSSLIFALSQGLVFYNALRTRTFIEETDITVPQVSAAPAVGYFLAAAALLGAALFFVPVWLLRRALRVLFTLLFVWGLLVLLALSLPLAAAAVTAVVCGLAWYFWTRVWLHDLLLMFTLVSIGSVFGTMFSPWTVTAFLAAVSVYDLLAVRFGYMQWMVKQMSASEVLPAFLVPKSIRAWSAALRGEGFRRATAGEGEREFSVLGGGDVGLPLLLVSSAFFEYGLKQSVIVAAFALAGLVAAYWVQSFFLKGRPIAALPPIAGASIAGLVIARLLV